MTILQAVDGNRHGNLTDATARRLRGELAERNISKTWLATQLGVSKMWLTRRTSGTVPMSTEDLEAIEQVTGISYVYLITGIKPADGGDEPGGARPVTGIGPKKTKRGSLDYLYVGSRPKNVFQLNPVVPLRPAATPLRSAS